MKLTSGLALPWLFTISFILITFLPRSIDDTMFMDGVTYASIARNMAEGRGTFWQPYFAHSFWLPYDNDGYFYGHPPLQFGIQAILFFLFGDSPVIENIYNSIILTVSILLIVSIWKQFYGSDRDLAKKSSWLPVLCWYSMLIVWFSVPNNFLDSTMSVFCLLSIWLQMIAFSTTNNPRKYSIFICAGLCILLAFLTKGPVGVYPLAFPFIYLLINKKNELRQAIFASMVLFLSLAISFYIILMDPKASFFFTKYFNGQIVAALSGQRETTARNWTAHFHLVVELFRSIYPHLIIVAFAFVTTAVFRFKANMTGVSLRTAATAFVTGCSVVLPMLISAKQYHHYLLPAMPVFAIFFGALLVDKVMAFIERFPRLSVPASAIVTIGCWVITARKIGNISNDIAVENAHLISRYVPIGATVDLHPDLWCNADIHANFQRYNRLSFTSGKEDAKFMLTKVMDVRKLKNRNYIPVRLHDNYQLLIKKSPFISAVSRNR